MAKRICVRLFPETPAKEPKSYFNALRNQPGPAGHLLELSVPTNKPVEGVFRVKTKKVSLICLAPKSVSCRNRIKDCKRLLNIRRIYRNKYSTRARVRGRQSDASDTYNVAAAQKTYRRDRY